MMGGKATISKGEGRLPFKQKFEAMGGFTYVSDEAVYLSYGLFRYKNQCHNFFPCFINMMTTEPIGSTLSMSCIQSTKMKVVNVETANSEKRNVEKASV